jgi:hypothetical protein
LFSAIAILGGIALVVGKGLQSENEKPRGIGARTALSADEPNGE